jgi:hypothetical protein
MSYRSTGEPILGLKLTAVDVEWPATKQWLTMVTNLEKYNSEGGEPICKSQEK